MTAGCNITVSSVCGAVSHDAFPTSLHYVFGKKNKFLIVI